MTRARKPLSQHQLGFTLIELMMALLVSAIVLMGVFSFATIQKDTANMQQRHVLLHQALEGSMHSMGTDLRMAGLGFGRQCSEIRVYSEAEAKLINPGAVIDDNLGDVFTDQVTTEPYWVLRDGVQAHWRSGADVGANDMPGTSATSASPTSAADSFDVFRGELNLAPGSGLFKITALPIATGGGAFISFTSSDLLDSGDNLQLAAVRQMFAPGSFVLVVPVSAAQSYVSESQSQCALVQITGEVNPGGGGTNWELPVGDNSSFNVNLETLLGLNDFAMPDDATASAVGNKNGTPFGADWDPANFDQLELVPLGRVRWSRYEIDYTVADRPMLVRSDIIGWRDGDQTVATTGDYPGCTGGACRMPRLYLPSNNAQPPRVAIGPMIEDMQVAVGCDGWSSLSEPVTNNLVPTPDFGFEEIGPISGPLAGLPNRKVDERAGEDNDRANDEWLGNASGELWAPDCVSWGTAERNAIEWASLGPGFETAAGPGFRMSPQIVRVTLLAKPDTLAGGGDSVTDAFYNQLVAIEDRPTMDTAVGNREYRTLTERFQIRNGHWRDPALQ
jgi:prepilin-type N-terminal cleavage/methylation domain-containing protein